VDDITVIPVYQMVHALRQEIANHLALAAHNVSANNFDEAHHLLTETNRLVLVLQTISEE
jgi:hypothetical protein